MSTPPKDKPIKLVRKRLDDAGVKEHFERLTSEAQAIEIRIKGAPAHHSDATAAQLEEASRQLRAGEIVAVQIRFHQNESWWCDTVMRKGESYRLVRMLQDEQPATS